MSAAIIVLLIVLSLLFVYVSAVYRFSSQLSDEGFSRIYAAGNSFEDDVLIAQSINIFLLGISVLLLFALAYLSGIQFWIVLVIVLLFFSILLSLGQSWSGKGLTVFYFPVKAFVHFVARLRSFWSFSRHGKSNSSLESSDNYSPKQEMLKEILHFGNETVKDILTYHVDIVDIDYRMTFHEVLDIIAQNKYSRMPVYSNNKDNIVGILYIKDLLSHLEEPDDFCWQNLIRPHICVPETKKIDNLLREFQTKKIHLSVVVDEYGGVTGVVTLEDIIEEILGEINDEFDDDKSLYIKISRDTYIFDAKITILEFCRIFNIDDNFFEEMGDDTSTLARFVIDLIGDVPRKHQIVRYKQFVFEILNVDARHVSKIKVSRF